MPWYKAGTATVTKGSPDVVGVGTTWGNGAITPGDSFSLVDSAGAAISPHYEVLSVTDDSHLTLTANYGGTSATGAKYALWNLAGEHTTPYLSALVASLVQKCKTVLADALGYTTRAETAAATAEAANTDAQTAKNTAVSASGTATSAKTAAIDAKNAAVTAKTAAETAKTGAEAAKTGAESAQTAAQTNATNAAASATNASNSATAAAASVSSVQPGVPGGIATLGADGKVPDAQQTKVYVGNATDAEITALLKPGDMYIR